jgi:hypothetical protein
VLCAKLERARILANPQTVHPDRPEDLVRLDTFGFPRREKAISSLVMIDSAPLA